MIILRQRTFSDNLEQREFNSKAQKLLRNKYDIEVGAKDLKKGLEKLKEYAPKDAEKVENDLKDSKMVKRWGRTTNRSFRTTGNANNRINGKQYARDMEKKGKWSHEFAEEAFQNKLKRKL